MRNIKAKARWVQDKHEFWVPGYWYPSVKWVTRSFSYPTIKFNWVPGYLWKGWLPLPGHYEPRIIWKKASINIPTIIWKYRPPRKITYYTARYVFEAGDQLNDKKIITTVLSINGMALGIRTMAAGLGMIGATEGLGTPVGVFVFGMGTTGFLISSNELVNSFDDPWVINIHDPSVWHANQ